MANQHDLTKDNVVRRRVVEELVTEGQPKAVAKFAMGFTVNLGNYESCKIDAGIELEGQSTTLPSCRAWHRKKSKRPLQNSLSSCRIKTQDLPS